MRRFALSGAVILALLPVLTGCGGAVRANSEGGGCNARVRLDDVVYRPHNALNQEAPKGRSLGSGDVIGCGGATAQTLDTVQVFAVKGVDPSVAVVTDDGEWHAVYVAEGISRSSWPGVLRDR